MHICWLTPCLGSHFVHSWTWALVWQPTVHRYKLSASFISCSLSFLPIILGLSHFLLAILEHTQMWPYQELDSVGARSPWINRHLSCPKGKIRSTFWMVPHRIPRVTGFTDLKSNQPSYAPLHWPDFLFPVPSLVPLGGIISENPCFHGSRCLRLF